jgi:hypothetical protein
MTQAELEVGQTVVFDVRGEKVGQIVSLFEVDGVRYASLQARISCGFVEHFPRVGMARIYPNMPIR